MRFLAIILVIIGLLFALTSCEKPEQQTPTDYEGWKNRFRTVKIITRGAYQAQFGLVKIKRNDTLTLEKTRGAKLLIHYRSGKEGGSLLVKVDNQVNKIRSSTCQIPKTKTNLTIN